MNKDLDNFIVTNSDKIIYPKYKITKLDIIKYYAQVSPFMFPFLDKRLISVIRCHNGIDGESFFKKHPTTEKEYVKKYKIKGEDYFYLKDYSQIIYQAQMGTIEYHIWASKVTNINKPDIMTFDLDPDEKLNLKQLRQGVIHLKNILDELSLRSFIKTSGGKGYHILVPFRPSANWTKFNQLAKQIALVMEQKYPMLYTTNIRKDNRKGKIFIDFLRNKKGATCVAPYSLRIKEKPSVSTPIFWDELDKISPNQIDMEQALKRLNKKNPWEDFFNY